ncbi:MAG: NUDIX domain-containing protein [Rickettsiales bacterium]|nr:MAG: NUDIX domain-containing protein [Rickettsiales bacterium]
MYKVIVWVMLERENKILLLKKPNGEWTLTGGGHVENNESLKDAALRKVQEETNLKLNSKDLEFLCVMDREMDNGYKVHVFFKASKWEGEINNNEPEIHSEIKWCDIDNIPENIGILAAAAIDSSKTGKLYHFKDEPEIHNKH